MAASWNPELGSSALELDELSLSAELLLSGDLFRFDLRFLLDFRVERLEFDPVSELSLEGLLGRRRFLGDFSRFLDLLLGWFRGDSPRRVVFLDLL